MKQGVVKLLEEPMFLEERDPLDPPDEDFEEQLDRDTSQEKKGEESSKPADMEVEPSSSSSPEGSTGLADPIASPPVRTPEDSEELSGEVDISIVLTGIRSWYCAKIIGTEVRKGQKRYRVKPLSKMFPPRWVNQKYVRKCPHNPQITSPHESVVATVTDVPVEDGQIGEFSSTGPMLSMGSVSAGFRPRAHSMGTVTETSANHVVVLTINGQTYQMIPKD